MPVNKVKLAQKVAKDTLPVKKYKHAVRVKNRVRYLGKKFEIVALLHDVPDCRNVNTNILESLFDRDIIHSVNLLSKRKFMQIENPYKRDKYYLSKIFTSKDKVAKAVKIYDAIDNLANRAIPQNKRKLVVMTIKNFYINAAKIEYPNARRWLLSRLKVI